MIENWVAVHVPDPLPGLFVLDCCHYSFVPGGKSLGLIESSAPGVTISPSVAGVSSGSSSTNSSPVASLTLAMTSEIAGICNPHWLNTTSTYGLPSGLALVVMKFTAFTNSRLM